MTSVAARALPLPLRTRWQPAVVVGLAIPIVMMLAGFFLPLPFDPEQPGPQILQPPGGEHLFGTDRSGMDVFSRTIAAAQRDLPLALAGTAISLLLGVPLGLLASSKGRAGERMMRGLDVFQAFPLLVLAIALVTLTGNKVSNVVLAIAVINVPRFMRLVRSQALSLRESRFVEAAYAMGATRRRVLFRHIAPNVTGLCLVQASLAAAQAIVVIAALSFLGVGVSVPEPTWGSMIQDGARSISTGDWWVVAFPGAAVFIAVLALNWAADGLQDRLVRPERGL